MSLFREVEIWKDWRPPKPLLLVEENTRDSESGKGRIQALGAIYDRIQKNVSVYLVIWLFCILTISSSPDVLLLLSDSKIELPIVGYKLDFFSFIIFSPFILEALLCNIYLALEQLDKNRTEVEFDHNIFADGNSVTTLFSIFVLYISFPLFLIFLSWKASVTQSLGVYCTIVTAIIIVQSCLMHLRRTRFERRSSAVFLYVIIGMLLLPVGLVISEWRKGLDLQYANLVGANLSGVDLSDSILSQADFSRANLANARFGNSKIEKANFSRSDLTNAIFSDPRDNKIRTLITSTSFRDATLVGANFFNTVLDGVTFKGSDMSSANLHKAELRNVDFSGVDLSRALALNEGQLRSACGDELTRLPPDFVPIAVCGAE